MDIYKNLGEELKRYQTIKQHNIQNILNCSDSDNKIFIDYFIKHKLLEKLDSADSYFVLKDNIDTLSMLFNMVVSNNRLSDKT